MADVYGSIVGSKPDLRESTELMKDFSEKKLFHQLIEAVFPILKELGDSPLAMQLFEKEIKPIGGKLNPVRYMELVGALLKKCLRGKSAEEKLTFVEENFAPFDVIDDPDVDADGDVKMGGDAAGKKTEKKDPKKPSSSTNTASSSAVNTAASSSASGEKKQKTKKAVGGLSHYSKASEGDFRDAKALYLSFKGRILIEGGKIEDAKDVLDELEKELFKKRATVSIQPKVFSWFYCAQLFLYHATQNASAYYRAGVNFLLYTPLDSAREEFVLPELALNLGISSLIAPGEFNFGELLELALYKLEEVKKLWIYDLVFAFQEGRYDLYDKVQTDYAAEVGKIKLLKENEGVVYEKFCSAVLMEYAFQQPKSKRTVLLSDLAKQIRVKDVETLLINAMCAELIRGVIDEVEGTFTYTWVKPRVLDMVRLKVLEDRVATWIDQQSAVLKQVEELTPELLVTV